MTKLSSSVTQLKEGRIPTKVTNIPREIAGTYLLSFTKYHQNEKKYCEMSKFKASHVFDKLRILQKCGDRSEISKWITPVYNAGNYAFLFNGLSEDAELYEMDCGKSGRIFLFMVQNIICIRLVKFNHIKT